MTETFTQSRVEDAIAQTMDFMQTERGATIDGAYAADQVAQRVQTAAERAAALLRGTPYPDQNLPGLYVPLSKKNAADYAEAVHTLPGHVVLVPSTLVESSGSAAFYPAVVSEDGQKTNMLRLHVLHQPYRAERGLGYGSAIMLSAAGQSESPGIGDHGTRVSDGVEAEHFATLLAASADQTVQDAWSAGIHVNHQWRGMNTTSVTTELSKRVLSDATTQSTRTITKQDIEAGRTALFWHEGLVDETTGRPEVATRKNALVITQGLGFQAIKEGSPQGIDAIKRLIA